MQVYNIVGALALGVSVVLAQNATSCVGGGICYAVNIPQASASSGSGDMFFQITGPSSFSWIGLGQGGSMSGANLFVIYTNSEENNVTLSPRAGIGERQPALTSTAQVTLLSGSGISNGIMTANVKCSNCNSWSGGSMSYTDSSSKWIWAAKSGNAISSDSTSAGISQHDNAYGEISFDLPSAAGGSSANPFVTSSAAISGGPTSDSGSSGSGSAGDPSDTGTGAFAAFPTNTYENVRMAHGILAPISFVLFFPFGAIAIRIFSLPGFVWFHAGWMVFTYLIVLASMGMGVWIAYITKQVDTYHSIIGLIVVCSLLLQPISGLLHHSLYKRQGRPNAATYPHVWWGRTIITLGIINGGLGLKLSDNTRQGEIAYGIVAAFMWLLWMAVILLAFLRTNRRDEKETGTSAVRIQKSNAYDSTEKIRPAQGSPHAPHSPRT